jgi:hypothetical protein
MTPRVLIAVCGLAALALPAPALDPVGVVLTAAGLVAVVISVLEPGSAAPLVLLSTAVLSWLATGSGAGTLRLLALALCLAVLHSAAAFAAVVPAGTPAGAGVVRPWLLRTAGTTAGGLAAAGAGALLPAPGSPPVAVVVAGSVAALLLAGWALLPRRPGPVP